MILDQLKLGPLDNFVYLIGDPRTAQAAVVDPAWDVPGIVAGAEKRGLEIAYPRDVARQDDECGLVRARGRAGRIAR
jgi:hypothetical protein